MFKKIAIVFSVVLLVGCGDLILREDFIVAEDLCKNKGGWSSVRVERQRDSDVYSITCGDGDRISRTVKRRR